MYGWPEGMTNVNEFPHAVCLVSDGGGCREIKKVNRTNGKSGEEKTNQRHYLIRFLGPDWRCTRSMKQGSNARLPAGRLAPSEPLQDRRMYQRGALEVNKGGMRDDQGGTQESNPQIKPDDLTAYYLLKRIDLARRREEVRKCNCHLYWV